MTILSDDDVAHVAMLARLGLSDAERDALGTQLSAILEHVSMLSGFDTADIPEAAQGAGLTNIWREDRCVPSLAADVALASAPDREDDWFRVGAIQE